CWRSRPPPRCRGWLRLAARWAPAPRSPPRGARAVSGKRACRCAPCAGASPRSCCWRHWPPGWRRAACPAERLAPERALPYRWRMARIDIHEGVSDAGIAAWLARRLDRALARSQAPVAIAVPGGSTPFPILAALARRPLAWRQIAVWPGDDRVVPEDHPASNTGRIRALLEPVGATVASLGTTSPLPHFALVWLGMGADGHIASLFPNTDPRAD